MPEAIRDSGSDDRPHRRGHHGAEGLSLGRAALRHQGQSRARSISPCLRPIRPPRRRASSRRTSRRRRRCSSRSVISTQTGGVARAIVVNSGCANACTGDHGMSDAGRMAAESLRALGVRSEQVLVASTGVIGVGLKMDRVVARHPRASRGARARQGQRDGPRHHDDRSVSEGVRGDGPTRRGDRSRSAARRRARA